MRVRQIWSWLYVHGVQDIDKMTTLSGALRNQLAEHHTLERLSVSEKQVSEDGTRKYLLNCMTGMKLKPSIFRRMIVARYAFPAKSGAP